MIVVVLVLVISVESELSWKHNLSMVSLQGLPRVVDYWKQWLSCLWQALLSYCKQMINPHESMVMLGYDSCCALQVARRFFVTMMTSCVGHFSYSFGCCGDNFYIHQSSAHNHAWHGIISSYNIFPHALRPKTCSLSITKR